MKEQSIFSKVFLVAGIFTISACTKGISFLFSKNMQTNPTQELAKKLSFTSHDDLLKEALVSDDTRLWYLLKTVSKEDPEWLDMVDKTHKLNPLWSPKDLMNLKEAGVPTYRKDITLRSPVIKPLLDMIEKAKKDEISLWVVSAYRDIAYQKRVWDASVALDGLEYTQNYVASPGTSQHHLGTVVDLNMANEAFNETPPALWLKENAHRFGFSLSYPEGHEKETGYSAESWHYRYFPANVLELIQEYYGGLQFAFLDFWFRNGETIKQTFNNTRNPLS